MAQCGSNIEDTMATTEEILAVNIGKAYWQMQVDFAGLQAELETTKARLVEVEGENRHLKEKLDRLSIST